MALHFVSTSVLTSEDGIDFSKETQLETEEAKKIRLEREKVGSKPLFMQLAEQQDKQQLERDKITKLIFAPPKGLDEEEYEFLHSVEESKQKESEYKKKMDDREIEQFKRNSKSNNHSAPDSNAPALSSSSSSMNLETKTIKRSTFIAPVIKAKKRKTEFYSASTVANSQTESSKDTLAPTIQKSADTSTPANDAFSLIGDYPSDED